MESSRRKRTRGPTACSCGRSSPSDTCRTRVSSVRENVLLSADWSLSAGRGNQEVMQFVTGGGRLSPPNSSTPGPINSLMQQCWNAVPEMRPTFTTIIERIGYALVDPEVLRTPLPIFTRAPSEEKTAMRPPPDSTDYLVPNSAVCSNSASNYSVATEKTELLSPDSCSTTTNDSRLVELLDESAGPPLSQKSSWKETTFSATSPESSSTATEVLLDPSKLPATDERVTKYVNV